jgi:hypothetical protein
VKFHNFVSPAANRVKVKIESERPVKLFWASLIVRMDMLITVKSTLKGVQFRTILRSNPLVLADLDGSVIPLVTEAQFDLVAPIYPALERLVFGAHLDNARQAFLEYVLEANRILFERPCADVVAIYFFSSYEPD